jgi:hypothetical protein
MGNSHCDGTAVGQNKRAGEKSIQSGRLAIVAGI